MSTAGQSTGGLSGQADPQRAAESRLPWIMTIYSVLCIVSTAFVLMRTYVRTVMIKQFGIDDGLSVAAMVRKTMMASIPKYET